MGYILIISIFVAAAFFLAMGGSENKKQDKEKEGEQISETVSPTPLPNTTTIKVYAAGTPALGEYPTMELKIDGVVVQTWKEVKGDPKLGKFDEFSYVYQGVISGQELQVGYTNDAYVAKDEDRNLYVDKLVIGDTVYVADSPATLTTITDKSDKQCTDGNTYSRWLLCNGYFTFRSYDKAFVPEPTAAAKSLSGSVVKVFAAGSFAGGDFPRFDLNIKGKSVASFVALGDMRQRLLGEYTYLHSEKIKISEVKVSYLNDYYGGTSDDRNLYIDRVNIDGVDYFADSPTVYQTGVWQSGSCREGYLRIKMLSCPGAVMRFGAREITN